MTKLEVVRGSWPTAPPTTPLQDNFPLFPVFFTAPHTHYHKFVNSESCLVKDNLHSSSLVEEPDILVTAST